MLFQNSWVEPCGMTATRNDLPATSLDFPQPTSEIARKAATVAARSAQEELLFLLDIAEVPLLSRRRERHRNGLDLVGAEGDGDAVAAHGERAGSGGGFQKVGLGRGRDLAGKRQGRFPFFSFELVE